MKNFNIQLIGFIAFLCCGLGCESSKDISINQPLIDNLFSRMFNPETCTLESRGEVIDVLLEEPIIGLDAATLQKWLGEPIHRRFRENGNTIFVYTMVPNTKDVTCGYQDLFCIEFNKEGKLVRTYLKFITEDTDLTIFWHSKKVPPTSKEGDDKDYYLNIF
jgi:hypothetical protein